MQTKNLAIVLLRVVAIFVMSRGFVFVAQLGSFSYQAQDTSGSLSLALALELLVPLATGIVIWLVSAPVAELAVKNLPPALEMGAITVEGLAHAAFIVLGVWLFIDTLPQLLAAAIQASEMNGTASVAWIAGSALECVFGVALVLGSGTLSGALVRLRYAGTNT